MTVVVLDARLLRKRTPSQLLPVSVEPSDVELMQRIAEGDAQAFRQLSTTHLGAIVTYATRILSNQSDAEDVAQETFLRAWKHAHKYRSDAGRVSTWLHSIAHNLAVDRLRKRAVRGEGAELDDERDAAPHSDRPSRLLERKVSALSIRNAIESLPDRQRQAVVLCHEQGLSNPEIARIMQCGVEAVESLLSRGRRTLRKMLSSAQSNGSKT